MITWKRVVIAGGIALGVYFLFIRKSSAASSKTSGGNAPASGSGSSSGSASGTSTKKATGGTSTWDALVASLGFGKGSGGNVPASGSGSGSGVAPWDTGFGTDEEVAKQYEDSKRYHDALQDDL